MNSVLIVSQPGTDGVLRHVDLLCRFLIEPGDTVAVWGCGPVGLFAVQSAFLMGAERVIAIDHFPHRLELAKIPRTTLNAAQLGKSSTVFIA